MECGGTEENERDTLAALGRDTAEFRQPPLGAKKLLRHGARVDVFSKSGPNAIMWAAQNGQLAALRLCLAAPGGAAAVDMLSGM